MNYFQCLLCILLLVFINASAQEKGNRKSSNTSALAQQLSEELPQIGLNEIKLMERYILKLAQAGVTPAEAISRGMKVMREGTSFLSEEEQREIKDLNDQLLDTYTEEERERLEALRIMGRQGKVISKADKQYIKMLLKKGFLNLPSDSQSRLRELNGKAIRAYLRTVQ